MNKHINLKSDIFKIILIFLSWKLALFLVLFMGIKYVPLGYTDRFLGGGVYYNLFPELFSWANFDGEHYLSIAIFGYKGLEQAFFPLFPLLISIFAKPFSKDLFEALINSTLVGILISNAAFLLSLIVLYKLVKIDFSNKITFMTILILVFFPTSFFFGALYNESLFLLLSLLSFYNARKGRWFIASIFGFFASTTRIFGVLLFPSLIIEAIYQKTNIKKYFWIILIPFGLIFYMIYQYLTVGDPIAFYRLQKLVGEQHQSGITLLPQVYFRYLKMLLTVDINNPIYQTILLEFFVGVLFFILPIYGYFKKIRVSYLFYAFVGFLLPSIQGSFSSVPRYIIVFFPGFIAMGIWLSSKPKLLKIILLSISAILLATEAVLYLRGYWVA